MEGKQLTSCRPTMSGGGGMQMLNYHVQSSKSNNLAKKERSGGSITMIKKDLAFIMLLGMVRCHLACYWPNPFFGDHSTDPAS